MFYVGGIIRIWDVKNEIMFFILLKLFINSNNKNRIKRKKNFIYVDCFLFIYCLV